MRMFPTNAGWSSMHDEVLFTMAMLLATEHTGLAPPLEVHLVAWEALEGERRAAARALVMTNARVAALDLRLDAATQRFGGQLLTDCGQNREHPTFRAFFPAAVNTITRLALESQLDAMKHFPTVAAEVKLSDASGALLDPIDAIAVEARRALDAREQAKLALTAVSLRQDAWRDAANTQRRGVEVALDDHATRCNLPRGYAADFFPAAAPAKKAEAAPRREEPAPNEATHPRAGMSEADQLLTLPDSIVRGLAEDFVATLPANVQRILRARRAG
jgi:hypothetical protein